MKLEPDFEKVSLCITFFRWTYYHLSKVEKFKRQCYPVYFARQESTRPKTCVESACVCVCVRVNVCVCVRDRDKEGEKERQTDIRGTVQLCDRQPVLRKEIQCVFWCMCVFMCESKRESKCVCVSV